MAARGVYLIHLELLEVHTGTWCPTCFLPSGAHLVAAAITPHGLGSLWNLYKCLDCGTRLPIACEREECP